MAFTKKFVKSKKEAPKAAASYARKKRQEEEEVVEEVEVEEVEEVEAEEEVQDDYDEQEEAAPAPSRTPARGPAPAPRRAPSAPSRSFGGQSQGQGEQKKALRLTGLFAGKREGCFSGKLRDEDADNLAALIEEAKATNQQVVFFVWENQGNPQFSLTANISAPFQKGGFNRGGNGGGFNRGGNGGNGGGFRKRW